MNRLKAELAWLLGQLSYWLRPFDLLADARRWRWQARLCCRCGRRHRAR